jgi:hypothetical protein
MLKSTLVKWAVAAVLAVPAVPVLARTAHHKHLVSKHSHRTAVVSSKHHHRNLKTSHRRMSLLAAKAHKSRRLVKSHRRNSGSTFSTKSHFRVHFTKMPPTIDGIRS